MGCDSSPSENCLLTTQQWFPLSAFTACPWQGLNAEQSPGEMWSGPYLGTAGVCRDSQLFLTFLLVFHLWDACENITVRARRDQGLQIHWRWTLPILLTQHEVLETEVPKIMIHQESILLWATSDAWRGTNQGTPDHTCNIWNDQYRGVMNFRKLKQIFFRRNRCSIPRKKQRCKSTFSGAVFCTKTYRSGEIFYSLHSRLRFRFLTEPEVKDTLHQLSALPG